MKMPANLEQSSGDVGEIAKLPMANPIIPPPCTVPPPPMGTTTTTTPTNVPKEGMKPIGAGNHDKAWNDPPLFSIDDNTRPPGPRGIRTKLSARVAFPLGGTSSAAGISPPSYNNALPPNTLTSSIPSEINCFVPSLNETMTTSNSNVIENANSVLPTIPQENSDTGAGSGPEVIHNT